MNVRAARELRTIAKALYRSRCDWSPSGSSGRAGAEVQGSRTPDGGSNLEPGPASGITSPRGGVTGRQRRKSDGHKGAEPGYEDEGSHLSQLEPKRKRRKRKRRQECQREEQRKERAEQLEPQLERRGRSGASPSGVKLELRPRDDMVEASVKAMPSEPGGAPRTEEADRESPLPEGTSFLKNRHDDLKIYVQR